MHFTTCNVYVVKKKKNILMAYSDLHNELPQTRRVRDNAAW